MPAVGGRSYGGQIPARSPRGVVMTHEIDTSAQASAHGPTVDGRLRESGPSNAERTVLLLPGGMCSAGSYAEVMAQPALAQTRLVAATLPGQAGAPSPDDYSVQNYARSVSELAATVGADVVVGFSMGAVVAAEMV